MPRGTELQYVSVWILYVLIFLCENFATHWTSLDVPMEAGACKSSASRPASAVSEVLSPTTGPGQAECRKKRKHRTERAGLREIHEALACRLAATCFEFGTFGHCMSGVQAFPGR